MNLETLMQNASDDELRTLAGIMHRANQKPCVLVTVNTGRRYVVAREDEDQLRPLVGHDRSEWQHSWDGFGAQWLRGYGRVDEMYRTLSLSEVVKIAEAPRNRVWNG